MNKESMNVVWPRDIVLPVINDKINKLLQYLIRDNSWKGCFNVQIEVGGILDRLKREKLLKGILDRHPEITDDYLANLVGEVSLGKGLATSYNGIQMTLTKKDTSV
jgi:hypothetical protein